MVDDEYEEESKSSNNEEEDKAINLIVYDQQRGILVVVLKIITGFYVSDEAVELLRNVKEKIGVIAVAGKYRTGKSFLLNRIILNKTDNNGFGVGPTINPCTKVRILYIYSGRDCGFGISR